MPLSWLRSKLIKPAHSQRRRLISLRAVSLIETLFVATAFLLAACAFVTAASCLLWLNSDYAPSLSASLALLCRFGIGLLTVALVAASVFAMRALLDPCAGWPPALDVGRDRERSCFASKGPDAGIIAASTSSWDGG